MQYEYHFTAQRGALNEKFKIKAIQQNITQQIPTTALVNSPKYKIDNKCDK